MNKICLLTISCVAFLFSSCNMNNQLDSNTLPSSPTKTITTTLNNNLYTISFMLDDKVLQSEQYHYGETPVYKGEIPTKESENGFSYDFLGWDHDIETVTKDDVYYALFSKKAISNVEFVNVNETYYPYSIRIKDYLEANNPDVHNYVYNASNQASAIVIQWTNGNNDVSRKRFYYSKNENFEDATEIEINGNANSVSLFGLEKATKYYCKLEFVKDNEKNEIKTSFNTTDLGPRTFQIGGIFNTRDLGGYLTDDGKRTKQGLVIRGGALSRSTDTHYDGIVSLTEEGGKYLKDVLHIKQDFDLRSKAENLGLTESPIPGAGLMYFGVDGYENVFTNYTGIKNVFKELAKKENYPLYIHCTGGADRTGTVCFLMNAILGVSETDLIHDYEFTTFSIYGERNSRPGTTYNFSGFYEKLKKDYEGDTLKEKVNNYLLSIGVKQEEIDAYKAIMLGEELGVTISAPEIYEIGNGDLNLSLSKSIEVRQIYIDEEEIDFIQNDKNIKISEDNLNSFSVGNHKITLKFVDQDQKDIELDIEFKSFVDIDGYFDFGENNSLDISSQTSSNLAVGYNKDIRIKMKTYCGTNGGVYVLVGSYGIYLRGGEFRTAIMQNGVAVEKSRYLGLNCPNTCFNDGESTLILNISPKENAVKIKIKVLTNNVVTYEYEYENADWKASDEIDSNNAKLTFSILQGEQNAGDKLTIYKHNI